MEVKIISKENIKPSSPTPKHLKILNLSLLDQIIPALYAPLILFYPMDHIPSSTIPSKINSLKKSLSTTLTLFYPLAGKIRDKFSIDCNDEGSSFIETRVNCTLKDFLIQPNIVLLQHFLPCGFIRNEPIEGSHVSNFQVNNFECGGIAIGICISHRILDGAALSTFLKSWTAAARGGEVVKPNFFAYNSDLFIPATKFNPLPPKLGKGKCTTRRFVFDPKGIAALRSQATGGAIGKFPTRVEAVSSFLWKSVMAASKQKNGFQKPSILTHTVNLRRRLPPAAVAENSIGNLFWIAAAKHDPDSKSDLPNLVGEIREAISKIDGEFVKKIVGESELISENMKSRTDDGIDFLRFSSLCNFDFYGADFGWGNPVWVSSIGLEGPMLINLVILVETNSGDGVEAWVTLDQEEMGILQRDSEVRCFALLDPSPLLMGSKVMGQNWAPLARP